MTHTKTRIFAASLVAMFTLAAFAAPSAAAEQKYLVVLDTPEGMIEREVTQSELDVMLVCSADAPLSPTCFNGPAVRSFAAGHGLVLPIPSGFGTPAGNVPAHKMIFTSFLRSNAGTERVFRCELNQLPPPAGSGSTTFACFPGAGAFPPIGSTMTQEATGLLATQGGAGDTVALQVYQATGGDVVLAGLGKFRAQLTY